ncbi:MULTISPECIES: type II secretion system major pseudopilin GspG [Pseudoalteromonas]|uniref:Type II secretion system core protein G n=3 Tax=Pseudoalteromonas TaxID=53246 RepID=A0A8I2H5K4_9GAMM|nr:MULTISPECIES: type II secretion system major pseudopilin GspG [Pseudoalteromonas]MBD0780289.1 type II secretion system protein GspG [Pseudoalteromonas flavipulchra]MBE0371541.1 general secretion pathway protein G [Pseudoalteromonas flavipulchra NCIMB 2033 = ATCC BAA-314]NLR23448.1 type II secretion system protein GspG [Pseudoalteromonas maricaloris]QUI62394.1 type II secretion system major pseudopilin GspG [Pseudoalteromonas sp. A22]RZG14224.1 type II secretion system protein GspG [Pseudoal
MKNNMKAKNKHNGFTMMELLIVIVILGLLASLVAPKFFNKLGSASRDIAAAQMNAFETALDTYRLDIGTYPQSLNELRESDNPRWDGPYLPKNIPLDPWGNSYNYSQPGNNGEPYSLFSFGADGKEGGEGDNRDIIHK